MIRRTYNLLAVLAVIFSLQLNAQDSPETDPYLKSLSLVADEEYANALQWISKISLNEENENAVYLLKGQVFLKTKDYHGAINAYRSAAIKEPQKSAYGLAEAYALSNQYDSALVWLEKHLTSPYRKPASEIQMNSSFAGLERSRGWRSLWAEDYYSTEEKASSRARYLLRSGNTTETLKFLNDSLSKYDHPALYILRAEVYDSLKNYKAAYKDIQKALEKERKAEYYVLSAHMALKLDQFEDARTDASNALRLNPGLFKAYIARATAEASMADYRSALDDMDQYLAYFPEDAPALGTAGNIALEAENYLKALGYFNKALKLSKAVPEYFVGRGKAYLKTSMNEYAYRDFSMALDLNPRDGETWYLKGLARRVNGDYEGACIDFEKAFKRGYKEALKELQENCKSVF